MYFTFFKHQNKLFISKNTEKEYYSVHFYLEEFKKT